MGLIKTKYSIKPMLNYNGDTSGMVQFYIVISKCIWRFILSKKYIGQDGGKIPFQDIQSVESYYLMLVNKTQNKEINKLLKILKQ